MDRLRKKRHCVFRIECHVIFVVKYRRKYITEEISRALIEDAGRLFGMWDAQMLEANTDLDHIHFLVSIDPGRQISDMIGSVKGVLSRNVRKRFRDQLVQYLWGDSFWTDSYYIASVGENDAETVRQYIESQGRPKKVYRYKNKKGNSSPPQSEIETGSSCLK